MVLTNRIALFSWILMLLYMVLVALMTWVAIRDWATLDNGGLVILALPVFWLGGLFGCRWAFQQEVVRVEEIGPGRIIIRRSTPFRTVPTEITRLDEVRVELVQDQDSDGDPYFRGVVVHGDGERVTVSEGHQRQSVETDLKRLLTAFNHPAAPTSR